MNKIDDMPKKKIVVLLMGSLVIEFLLAWAGFVFFPVLGLVCVLVGWVTSGYGIYLLVRQPKKVYDHK